MPLTPRASFSGQGGILRPAQNKTSNLRTFVTCNILDIMRNLYVSILILLCALAYCPRTANSQGTAKAFSSSVISADLGPCSVLITVTGADSKPIFAAKMTTRIQYGPLSVKRLDLEAYTGSDGQLRITNLPESLKKPMYIHITKDELGDMVEFNPKLNCHATFSVQLRPE
jgi:hypothetical protein